MEKSYEDEHPVKTFGWAARDSSGEVSRFHFSRRATGEKDVQINVMYCGICHHDLHHLTNKLGNTKYPIVPGHELVGVITEVGSKVEKFEVGDEVGVGCIVESCRNCDNCNADLENYCPAQIHTYNDYSQDGTLTFGGFSVLIVCDEHFVVRWPEHFSMGAAPLLCAGITVYSPLKYFGLDKPGMHIGVVGLGGQGHLAVKFAKAFGCKVTVISICDCQYQEDASKKQEAERLGADSFLVTRDPEQVKAATSTLDGIIDTVSEVHPILPLLMLMKSHGKLVMVNAPEKPVEFPVLPLLLGRKLIAGSRIGGIKETQEMIDFAVKHNIIPDYEIVPMLPIDHVNYALERLLQYDVKYRFVIDIYNNVEPRW